MIENCRPAYNAVREETQESNGHMISKDSSSDTNNFLFSNEMVKN